MIHYHGADISGGIPEALKFYNRRDVLISFPRPYQTSSISEVCRSFVFDNGAFSFWKKCTPVNWDDFYDWVDTWNHHPRFEWFLIPDVIGGSDKENDELIAGCAFPNYMSVPVYHVGEDFSRLENMMDKFPRVAIGTTKGFELKSLNFWNEMRKIFDFICVFGVPQVKVHGLRMLDPEIVSAFPFSSCDSAGACIISVYDNEWNFPYAPITKAGRAALYADKIERSQSPSFYEFKPIQMELI
jgi:hypothetical protein